MNPIELTAWAFWGGVSLLILAVPVFIISLAYHLGRKM